MFIYLFIVLFSFSANAFNIPGEVPLFELSKPEARLPAVDLIYNGEIQSAEQLRELELSWAQQRKNLLQKNNLSEKEKEHLRRLDISKLAPSPQLIQKNWIDKLFLVEDGFKHKDDHQINIDRTDKTKSIFKKLDDISFDEGDLLDFIDIAPFKANNLFDFRGKTNTKNGLNSKQYRVFLGPLAHNIMLRKTLLRKIGFKEPGFKYLSHLKVKFKDETDALTFLGDSVVSEEFGISSGVNEDPRRWVTNVARKKEKTQRQDPETGEFEDVEIEVWDLEKARSLDNEDEYVLHLQDVVVYEETAELRLSLGFLQHQTQARQRLYNSLLMAFNIIDVPESVNLLGSVPFSIKSKKMILTHNYGEAVNEFSPDIYDVKWMARKIASLSRADFVHLVEEAYYPKEVAALLVELLIARRNFMQKFFFADDVDCKGSAAFETPPYYCLGEATANKFPELSKQFVPDLKISLPPRLVNGRLTIDTRTADYANSKKWWVGYGSRFSFHLFESPLVFSEVLAYFKSILQSSLLAAIIDKNINDVLRVDVQKKSIDIIRRGQQEDLDFVIEQINTANESGQSLNDLEFKQLPLRFEHFPTASGQLILNRNIVLGNQNGVDDQVQLVDTFGYLARFGVHGQAQGVENLNLFNQFASKVDEPFIGFDIDFSMLKRWTHVRPIVVQKIPGLENQKGAIAKALQEDYKKILVPKILRDFKSEIETLNDYNFDADEAEKEAYRKAIEKNYKVLNKYLKPSESLIISTSIGPSVNTSLLQIFNDDISNLSKNITGSGELFVQLLADFKELSRVHIQRRPDESISIYKTQANQVTWGTTVAYKKYIPVTRLSLRSVHGTAKTKFYNLKNVKPTIGSSEELNTQFQDDLKILVETINQDSFTSSENFDDENLLINRKYEPYDIWHDYRQGQFNFRFLFFDLTSFGLFDELELYSPYNESLPSFPAGETTKYARHSRGIRQGLNFQQVAVDLINLIFQDKDIDGSIQIPSGSDPADTLFGRSASLSIVLDAKVSNPSPGVLREYSTNFTNPFLKFHYKWKGGVDLGLKPKKIKKLLKSINKKMNIVKGHELFDISELSKTDRLQFYQVAVDLVVYKEGFYKLFDKSTSEFNSFVKRRLHIPPIEYFHFNVPRDQLEILQDRLMGSIESHYARAKIALKNNNYKSFMSNATFVVQLLQENMPFKDFISLFEKVSLNKGQLGPDFRNIYMKGVLTGFRKGDESIEPIQAKELGFARKKAVNGSFYDYTYGEIDFIKNRIGISDGELNLTWLLESFL